MDGNRYMLIIKVTLGNMNRDVLLFSVSLWEVRVRGQYKHVGWAPADMGA